MGGGISFLNSSTGWVASGDYESCAPELRVSLDKTSDSGATWSQKIVSLPLKDYGIPFDSDGGEGSCPVPTGGVTAIAFADHLHGLMSIFFHGQTMNSWTSILLLTSDGGRTWKRAANAPEMSQTEMLLTSPTEGWLYGNDESESGWSLYVTRDGGHSWQPVPFKLPDSEETRVMGLPTFEDAQHALLHVNANTRSSDHLYGIHGQRDRTSGGHLERWLRNGTGAGVLLCTFRSPITDFVVMVW